MLIKIEHLSGENEEKKHKYTQIITKVKGNNSKISTKKSKQFRKIKK